MEIKYDEKIVEILENSGTLDNGKPWENFTVVTVLRKNGIPFKLETYKGSTKKVADILGYDSVAEARENIIGCSVSDYSYDKYGKLKSFVID